MKDKTLLTTSDVAQRAASRQDPVTTATVRAWERAGKLPARRTLGGVRLFRPGDVDRLLAIRQQARQEKGR